MWRPDACADPSGSANPGRRPAGNRRPPLIADTVSRFMVRRQCGGWLLATSVALGAARDQRCHELLARIDDVFPHQPAAVGVPPFTHRFEDLGVFDVGIRAPLRHFGKEVTWEIE